MIFISKRRKPAASMHTTSSYGLQGHTLKQGVKATCAFSTWCKRDKEDEQERSWKYKISFPASCIWQKLTATEETKILFLLCQPVKYVMTIYAIVFLTRINQSTRIRICL